MILITGWLWAAAAGAETLITYQDAAGRFAFDYPAAWGEVSPGTNDGFGGRAAALRFSRFTPAALGGEMVLTRGRVTMDLQLLGGLYDAITLEAVPEETRRRLDAVLPSPILHNFCALLETPRHLNPNHRMIKFLPEAQIRALEMLDAMRNVDPKVHVCRVVNHTVVFHKEATFKAGQAEARQHLYGAVRLLKNRYSSFQLVRGELRPPDPALLQAIADAVNSLRLGK